MRLSLFDLDPTLLDGDSDPLWCDGPIARGLLPRQPFAAANPRRMRDDAAGRASAQRFSDFYSGTLAGRSAAPRADEGRRWFADEVAPRFEAHAHGRLRARPCGTPNLRAGKLERLHTWLQAQRSALGDCPIAVYSDSINPLPLPAAAPQAVAVDPDERLAAEAAKRGWPVISLR